MKLIGYGLAVLGLLSLASCQSTTDVKDRNPVRGGAGGEATSSPAGATSTGGSSETGGSSSEGGSATGSTGGSSSEGGSSGATNSLPGLGSSCTDPSDCASNQCVEGICCDAPCDDVCEQCSAAGHCEKADDDDSCETISCADRECNLTSDIADHRCKARGECKTSDDCEYFPDAGLSCGDFVSCQPDGTCADPGVGVVSCGAASCDTSNSKCCMARYAGDDGAVFGCQQTAASCDTTGTTISVHCDEHADCAQGELCSLSHIESAVSTLDCRTPANCDSIPANCYPICESPAGSWTCPSGTYCIGLEGASGAWTPVGFGYCTSE